MPGIRKQSSPLLVQSKQAQQLLSLLQLHLSMTCHSQLICNYGRNKAPVLKINTPPTMVHLCFLMQPLFLITSWYGWICYKQILTMAPHLQHFHVSQVTTGSLQAYYKPMTRSSSSEFLPHTVSRVSQVRSICF